MNRLQTPMITKQSSKTSDVLIGQPPGCNDQQEVCKNFQSVHLLLLPVLGGENADVYKERALPVTADPLIVLRSNRTFSRGAVTSYFSSE